MHHAAYVLPCTVAYDNKNILVSVCTADNNKRKPQAYTSLQKKNSDIRVFGIRFYFLNVSIIVSVCLNKINFF